MAAPAKFLEEECFNVFWKIKKFNYGCGVINSPEFYYGRCKLYLQLNTELCYIECKICYSYFQPIVQISILTCDGSPEESVSGNGNVKLQAPKDVIFGNRKSSFLPEDTLTIRLQIPSEDTRNLYICSQVGLKTIYVLWNIKRLNKQKKCIENSEIYGNINLILKTIDEVNSAEQFSIEINRTGGERCSCFLKVSILDVDGNAVKEVSDNFVFEKKDGTQTRGFPSIIKKSKWLAYQDLLLTEDVFSLKCNLVLSQGKVSDETAVISCCDNAAQLLKESCDLSTTFHGKKYSSDRELQTDLKSILEDGTFSDASLHIGTETIKVHKNILSARSPVFKAMFRKKDLKESISNVVLIEDIDLETVQRLLLFMYTDRIPDKQWENIKKLYLASDKYEVLSLKTHCASFLTTNLSISNVCEALMLSDLYQDASMKAIVLDFISEYDSAVFASESWKELEKTNSPLVIQSLREICCKKRF